MTSHTETTNTTSPAIRTAITNAHGHCWTAWDEAQQTKFLLDNTGNLDLVARSATTLTIKLERALDAAKRLETVIRHKQGD